VALAGLIVWVAVDLASTVQHNSDITTSGGTDAILIESISPPDVLSVPVQSDTRTANNGTYQQADATWVAATADAAGIPPRALAAYASAAATLAVEQPDCQIGWSTLAGIGHIESGHASHGGVELLEDGYTDDPIRGPALDGGDFQAIGDSDNGRWDGDDQWDRAVGPLQFIPQTWATWGADGNGDGQADPNQIDDAALAAARYLCHSGDLTTSQSWQDAIFTYNHDTAYVADVAAAASQYAVASRGGS
jgi:membrane-bound lytic murein transglycosylase B